MPWYTWVFSGVGVSLVLWAAKALYDHFYSVDQRKSPIPDASLSIGNTVIRETSNSNFAVGSNITQNVSNYIQNAPSESNELIATRPSLQEIRADIGNAMPFDKQQTGDKYKGLPIRWKLSLAHIQKHPKPPRDGQSVGDYWTIAAESCTNSYPSMKVMFDLDEVPPELKATPEGGVFWVKGIILGVQSIWVYLERNPEIARPDAE